MTPDTPASEPLPVVAWLAPSEEPELHSPRTASAETKLCMASSSREAFIVALVRLSDAQAIIARLTSERDAAVRERNGLRARIDRAVNAAEEVFGQDAVRYKLSLFKNGRARNYFPEHMDGGWFAFQRAENDAHIGLCDRITTLKATRPDPDAVMRLADAMVSAKCGEQHANQFGGLAGWARFGREHDAARAALLAKVRGEA